MKKSVFQAQKKNIKLTSQMKLKSFSYIFSLLIVFFGSPLLSEDKIDIWNNKKKTSTPTSSIKKDDKQKNLKINTAETIGSLKKIEIEETSKIQLDEQKVFGIYEPANYDLSLNMWSTTKAEDLRSSLK